MWKLIITVITVLSLSIACANVPRTLQPGLWTGPPSLEAGDPPTLATHASAVSSSADDHKNARTRNGILTNLLVAFYGVLWTLLIFLSAYLFLAQFINPERPLGRVLDKVQQLWDKLIERESNGSQAV